MFRKIGIIVVSIFWASALLAQGKPIAETSQGKSVIQLFHTKPHSYELKITSPEVTLQSAFLVDSPARLVVDLTAPSIKQLKSAKTSKADDITAIRAGVHADKIRLVLDIGAKDTPNFTSTQEPGSITVSITFGGAAPESHEAVEPAPTKESVKIEHPTTVPTLLPVTPQKATSAPQKPTIAPTSPPAPTLTVAPSATPLPVATPHHVATRTPEHLSSPAPAVSIAPTEAVVAPKVEPSAVSQSSITSSIVVDPNKSELTGIFFEHAGTAQSPVLRFSLSKRGEFKLSKSDDHLYELILSGYQLAGNHVGLPHFPPQDFAGLIYVQATNRNGGVKILIGVDRGVRISPVAKDTDILVQLQEP